MNLGYGNLNRKIERHDLQNTILNLCVFFKKPHLLTDVVGLPYEQKLIDKGITILDKGNYLIDYEVLTSLPPENHRFLLYLLSEGFDPFNSINLIKNKRFTIIGCGAIGTEAALLLTTLGIQNFILVDKDNYDITNVGRCINIVDDVLGLNKAKGLCSLLRRKNKDVDCKVITEYLQADNIEDIFNTDFVILSADASYLLYLINEQSIKHNVPFIQIGYAHDCAVW